MGLGKNTVNLDLGPNIRTKNSKKVYNNYYFNNEIFTNELETKGNMLSLYDSEFQKQLLNSDNAFEIEEQINNGYFPHLKMPECMPSQEYIELPEVEDADLPDILSTKILEQGSNTVKVEFSVNNPSAATISKILIENIGTVEIISQEYNNGKSTVIAELKNPTICVSSYDVQKLIIKGAFGSTYERDYLEGERKINVDLYREIWNENDWANIKNSPTENYMLMSDLDFINAEERNIYISNQNGIIEGNNHTIKNINLANYSSVISNLKGTLRNLYIVNFSVENKNARGFVGMANNALVDNVHLTNAQFINTASGRCGGLAAYLQNSIARNSSVTNIKINNIQGENLAEEFLGGMIGGTYLATIENCYVQDLEIISKLAAYSGIGGLVGSATGVNSIKNCYAEGKIISQASNVGGLIGKSSQIEIENCYTKVNISAENNYIGGILGKINVAESEVTLANNLSIGNIYTSMGEEALNRIAVINSNTENNNYSYEEQLLNGYKTTESKGATLLNKEKVLKLNLGDYYNYEGAERGVLPKLFNTEQNNILPNQKDIYLDEYNEGEQTVNIEIESIEINKPNSNEAEINIRLKNEQEVEITGIEIEDMETSITRKATQNGVTNIVLRGIPKRYYDSYKLVKIKYFQNINDANPTDEEGQNKIEQIKEVEVMCPVSFYKEIYTYEDWQTIEKGTYQNYRLMADIDFNGKTDINNNITINRLESENGIHTLKNINLKFDKPGTGLINNVRSSMKNIGFENIVLENTSGANNDFGVIALNNGILENLKFKNIQITANGMQRVGCIGELLTGTIDGINLEDITVNAGAQTGGLIGRIDDNYQEVYNINGNKITINSSSDYVGGIIGYIQDFFLKTNNMNIINSNITGKQYVGGLIGQFMEGNVEQFSTNNTTINGESYVGGLMGTVANNLNGQHFEVVDTIINGEKNYIGGIIGRHNNGTITYVNSVSNTINVPLVGSQDIGGIIGSMPNGTINNFAVKDTIITTNGKNVGGIYGNGGTNSLQNSCQWGYVENTIIQGNSNVGGAG